MLSAIATYAATLGIGTYYVRYYAILAAVLVVAIIGARAARRLVPAWLTTSVSCLVCFALIRVLLFGNPITLRFYQRQLTPEALGPRQWAVLDLDILEYQRDLRPAPLENLAVGSSQVGAIFSHWVSDPLQGIRVYSMAGMKALDLVLYEEAIASQNPQRIILYLSAFDLAALPELYSLPLAPSRPTSTWHVVQQLRATGLKAEDVDGQIHAFVASQLFPEYRYAFLFKAFTKPFFQQSAPSLVARVPLPSTEGSRVQVAWSSAGTQEPAVDEETARHVNEFVGYYYPEWLDYNFAFLKEFVRFCQQRGLDIVIAEGQVNPVVQSPKVDALEAIVRSRMAELELQFSNLTFVPASDTYRFGTTDYVDLAHVHREAAMKYTAHLSSLLGPAIDPLSTAGCGVTFLSGWHGREATDGGWLRWSDGSGQLRVTAARAMDLVLAGDVLSLARPNVVDVTVDGRVVRSLTIEDTSWSFHALPPLSLHLDAGQHALVSFVGHAPPAKQAVDERMLAVALKNLSFRSADGATSCALMPDAPQLRRPPGGI
ncbi:MAG: hypothetical protein ABMA15_08320 [Vicinamibacterales bacterium]